MLRLVLAASSLAAFARADQDHYNSTIDAGNFTVASVTVATDSGHFGPSMVATFTATGTVNTALTSGTVSWQVYQTGVSSYISSGNMDYFNCDNKGCDLASALALKLADPLNGGLGSHYTLSFDVTLPTKVSKSDEFRVVFWGQDQAHFPYDFSVTTQFDYSTALGTVLAVPTPEDDDASGTVCASQEGNTCQCKGNVFYGQKFANGGDSGPMSTLAQLEAAPHVFAHLEGSEACSNTVFGDPYVNHLKYCYCVPQAHYNSTIQSQAFTVDHLIVRTDSGQFAPSTTATVQISGSNSKALTAGAVKYQVYQTGVSSFITQGNMDYFQCTNKGCDLASPLALTLANPKNGGKGSAFTLKFPVSLPKPVGTSNEYRIVVWGQDQDHQPYDFSATFQFNM